MEKKIDLVYFCKELCIKEFSRLREQEASTINNASQIKQDTIVSEVGDCVHKQCRLDYIRRPAVINTKGVDLPIQRKKLLF